MSADVPHNPPAVHPATAAVLAAMPRNPVSGATLTKFALIGDDANVESNWFARFDDPEPLAATYAAAIHQDIIDWLRDKYGPTNRAADALVRRALEIERSRR